MQEQTPLKRRLILVVWAVFLIFLPITSFPYFPPMIGGDALVRPLSLYPLIIMVILFTIPRLISKPIPKIFIPLIIFVLAAIASTAISLLRGIEPALGISVEARILRGLLTLLIGCAIYLTTALLPETINDLRFTVRWIYAGSIFALFWGSLQAIYILHYKQFWFNLLSEIQQHISIRPLIIDRISGLTYEPHWYADQIITLILPWALASVLTGYSIFSWKWKRLTIEWILLIWSILIIPFTFSRAGLLNMIFLVFLTVLLLKPKNIQKKISENQSFFSPNPRIKRFIETIFAFIIVIIPFYIIGTRSIFFSRIWEYWQKPDANLREYITYLGFDARLTYSEAAYNTYEEYPLLGVGLGNYAFYFEEMLPYRPIAEVPEALRMITPEIGRDRLITSKNFYLRLLAETGIIGAILFSTFFIANVGYLFFIRESKNKQWHYWNIACSCGLIAFLLSAFTFDSFVIPNMWIIFGMIAATGRVFMNDQEKENHQREFQSA
jgi:hypothetical protein